MKEDNPAVVILTLSEIARKLQVSERTVKRYIVRGMPVLRTGGALRFIERDVLCWLRGELNVENSL